ncbi:plasmid partitioning protein RepB [Rhizobium sp. SSA_523]|uniref:plasmid partitioning protein RepB n=1 Tax=Rhizobium sp. SSA_523 TaxID=2952477 RepID=UPI0020911259|nr:plasmid partitioning protein RepB [Rhizobium sp. SSA_523]MCO5733244.1 plasmid partitioning protein RepB [Rhizobium sp. SSA_523]WKC21770.1 plasmid partitioning protein RepB [Rhizobium sp. SSA_523]
MTNARDRNQRMKSLFANVNPDELAHQAPPPPADWEKRRVGSSAVRSMDRAFVSIEEENKRLHEQLLSAETIVELDPDVIEPSFVRDRLQFDDNAEFASFVDGIRENGQRLPILVRPLAQRPGYFQAAYGHRRLRACQLLKRPVRAIIRELSDEELVISQGIENTERLNLSFIEQALFALALKDRGYTRDTISQALGRRDKKGIAYISHLTGIAAMIPEQLARMIGPAPSIGRPKWERLGSLIHQRRLTEHQEEQLDALLARPDWLASGSDQRFGLVVKALETRQSPGSQATEPEGEQGLSLQDIALDDGIVATVQATSRAVRFTIPEALVPGLSAWLAARLPELAAEFRRQKDEDETMS